VARAQLRRPALPELEQQLPTGPDGKVVSMIPDHASKAAEREFPCRCNEGYSSRGLLDTDCRCDDMRHALESA